MRAASLARNCDSFGLLLLNGEDLVGAVTVVKANPSVEQSP